MGTLVGLGVGLGLLLIADSFWSPPRTGPTRFRAQAGDVLARAGLSEVTPRALVLLCAASAIVAGLVVQAASGTPTVAAVFALWGGYLPIAVVRSRARRRQRELAEVWPEAVDNLASGVRAGLSLADAVAGLAHRGPEPLRDSFAAFAVDYQASGRFGESLDRLKTRLADPVGDRVVEGLRIAREVGGGELGRLLRNLSSYLREDARTRSELEGRQSWTVNGARLAVAAPWLVLLAMSFQPEVIARYGSAEGTAVLVGGAVACVVAYRTMMRLGRLPDERRVLR